MARDEAKEHLEAARGKVHALETELAELVCLWKVGDRVYKPHGKPHGRYRPGPWQIVGIIAGNWHTPYGLQVRKILKNGGLGKVPAELTFDAKDVERWKEPT